MVIMSLKSLTYRSLDSFSFVFSFVLVCRVFVLNTSKHCLEKTFEVYHIHIRGRNIFFIPLLALKEDIPGIELHFPCSLLLQVRQVTYYAYQIELSFA